MPQGRKTGGRQKGTPNQATADVQARLEALGCDPIEGMARLALDPDNSPELRGRMFSELAQYVTPKRKAIEHSGPNGEPLSTRAVSDKPLTMDEWTAQYGVNSAA